MSKSVRVFEESIDKYRHSMFVEVAGLPEGPYVEFGIGEDMVTFSWETARHLARFILESTHDNLKGTQAEK